MIDDFLVQSGVSLSRLANLAKVIEAGGVTAAARQDSANQNNQSLYSKQLADLEKAFGKPLFNRDGRGRKPTIFAKQLASSYSAFASAVSELVRDSRGHDSVVRIGAGDSVYRWLLLPVMSSLEGRFPSVAFELRNLRTREVIEKVQSGDVDIGIAELREAPDGVEARDLRRMEFGLYFHSETFGSCDARQVLSKQRLIGLAGSGSYVRNCRELQRRYGLPERFWLTFDGLPMVADSMILSRASAFLPLDMQDDLSKEGFGCKRTDEMASLSRSYSLLANKYTKRIRGKVGEVSEAMLKLIR